MLRCQSRLLLQVLLAMVAGGFAAAAQTSFEQEISSTESEPTFQAHVNVVTVRVVVRDKLGQPVGNLQQSDFALFDNGKPQTIQRFSMEENKTGKPSSPSSGSRPKFQIGDSEPKLPGRYIALLFDDLDMDNDQMLQSRAAVERVLSPDATSRIAIYTTSGRSSLDFTDDQAKIRQFLNALSAKPSTSSMDCPRPYELTYYVAEHIQKGDATLHDAMLNETIACLDLSGTPQAQQIAKVLLDGAVSRTVSENETRSRGILLQLHALVRRMTTLPGRRTILMLSPGWYTPEMQTEVNAVLDRAIHVGIVINTLQSRGLYVGDEANAANDRVPPPAVELSVRLGEMAGEGLLSEFSAGTGGISIQNRNDFDAAIRQLTEPPAFTYVLSFAPDPLKPDGRYHKLKIYLENQRSLSVQSRQGYYAPSKAMDSAQQAKDDIENAVFSQTVMSEIPISVHSEFFKTGDYDAKAAILAHVDLRGLRFRKENGRNVNQLTIVASLFDQNGNFVTGLNKTVNMRIRDETLASRLSSGITIRNTFPVKTGSYVVRLVIRDRDGRMSTANDALQIP